MEFHVGPGQGVRVAPTTWSRPITEPFSDFFHLFFLSESTHRGVYYSKKIGRIKKTSLLSCGVYYPTFLVSFPPSQILSWSDMFPTQEFSSLLLRLPFQLSSHQLRLGKNKTQQGRGMKEKVLPRTGLCIVCKADMCFHTRSVDRNPMDKMSIEKET